MRWCDLDPGDVYFHSDHNDTLTLVLDERYEDGVAFAGNRFQKQIQILRLRTGSTSWMYVSDAEIDPQFFDVIRRAEARDA